MLQLQTERHLLPAAGTSAAGHLEQSAPCGKRIVYFVNLFPSLTETFIYREVAALRGLGNGIQVVSIRKPAAAELSAESRQFLDDTHYVLPVTFLALVGNHMRAVFRFRSRYLSVLLGVVLGTHTHMRDRLRTLCHFVEAVTILPEVERYRPDHLHAHWAVGATTCALVVSRLLGVPFSFTAHAYDIWRDRLLLPEKLRLTEVALTCTDYNRRHLIEAYGTDPQRVRVVYHGVDVERFRPRSRHPTGEPRILSIGRLVEQKGFDRLLEACAALATERSSFCCDIVGEGPLRGHLEGLVCSLGLTGRVRFLGRMGQEEVFERYSAADIFALLCVPASDEDRDGIPNTLIEAMAMELPCVSTRFSGIPELVADGETGLLVEPGDPLSAAAALRTLLGDMELRQRMGRAGRRRVMERFTIGKSAAQLDELFTALIAAKRVAG